MAKIKVMSDSLANKIAAGEVVERPSSVVKELVENSIDAKSSVIKIFIEQAGLGSIKVLDNGEGMDEEDARNCFLRHATSKLVSELDLFNIHTLGFRGEALPSIASVSKVSLSSYNGQGQGINLYLENGQVIKQTKGYQSLGTVITIDELFYNTPARHKYIKSLNTENAKIIDIVHKLALTNPHITFELYLDQKLVFKTSSKKLEDIIKEIYSVDVALNLLELDFENSDFKVSGVISNDQVSRANKNSLYIAINNRIIKNYQISNTIFDLYRNILMVNRYPIGIINIQVDYKLVDVNVHPYKLEVRLSKQEELIDLIIINIKKLLNKQPVEEEVVLKSKNKQLSLLEKKTEINEYMYPQETKETHLINEQDQVKVEKTNNDTSQLNENLFLDSEDNQNKESITQTNSINCNENKQIQAKEQPNNDNYDKIDKVVQSFNLIGQYQLTYLVASYHDSLVLIDQHALQEKLTYLKFSKNFDQLTISYQPLLVPLVFNWPKSESLIVQDVLNKLAFIGIKLEPFGETSFRCNEIPLMLKTTNLQTYIELIVEIVINKPNINLFDLKKEALITLACKTSLKANHYLSSEEMNHLLRQLEMMPKPWLCPHGRPIVVEFTNKEIEKLFKRVV